MKGTSGVLFVEVLKVWFIKRVLLRDTGLCSRGEFGLRLVRCTAAIKLPRLSKLRPGCGAFVELGGGMCQAADEFAVVKIQSCLRNHVYAIHPCIISGR